MAVPTGYSNAIVEQKKSLDQMKFFQLRAKLHPVDVYQNKMKRILLKIVQQSMVIQNTMSIIYTDQ